MPWKETSAMNERVQFIADYLREEWPLSELCRMYGISRPTAYKWIERYEEEGVKGLQERSRAPHRHPNAVPEEIERRIVEHREAHPTWGPKKLIPDLRKLHPGQPKWPSLSTVGDILKRHGLVKSRRRRNHATPTSHPLTEGKEANGVWCADFKGDFRTQDGTRCLPFTLSDACTRFLLRCHGLERIYSERVKGLFEASFYEFGLPQVIRTDNGPPFASIGLGGLSRLSIWWMKLGIAPERIDPGKPYQNGKHERLHRTLKEEAINPPRRTLRAQQRAFDRFREEYNFVRPHEALGQTPPGDHYTYSPRSYSPRLAEIEYPTSQQVRRVKLHGEICWRGRRVFLSEVLRGEYVGLEEEEERYWSIYFADFRIGYLDEKTGKVKRIKRIERIGKEGEE